MWNLFSLAVVGIGTLCEYHLMRGNAVTNKRLTVQLFLHEDETCFQLDIMHSISAKNLNSELDLLLLFALSNWLEAIL